MLQAVVGVVLESNRRRGRPFAVFLGDSLLRDTLHTEFLAPSQLGNQNAFAAGVHDDGIPNRLVYAIRAHNQVSRVEMHINVF